jgi:hypothetical protein
MILNDPTSQIATVVFKMHFAPNIVRTRSIFEYSSQGYAHIVEGLRDVTLFRRSGVPPVDSLQFRGNLESLIPRVIRAVKNIFGVAGNIETKALLNVSLEIRVHWDQTHTFIDVLQSFWTQTWLLRSM